MAHFLQSVTSGLVLGGELVYHRGRAEEGGILTLAGQYSSKILRFIVNLPHANRLIQPLPLVSFFLDLAAVFHLFSQILM